MNPAELRAIGESIYGNGWKTELARELPCDPRTIRRWLDGTRRIRPLVEARIRGLKAELASVRA